MTDTDFRDVFLRDPRSVHAGLQERGLLPPIDEAELRPAEVLTTTFAAGARAHLDPQRPHAAKAGMYASFPSGLHPEFNPPELLIWGTGHNFSYLILYFEGLTVAPHVAGIDMEVWVNASTTITATNSPGLTVASGASSSRVTFQIPFKPNAQGLAVVSMTPGSQDQGFSWYGTDVFAA
jgi:hypothetical protein